MGARPLKRETSNAVRALFSRHAGRVRCAGMHKCRGRRMRRSDLTIARSATAWSAATRPFHIVQIMRAARPNRRRSAPMAHNSEHYVTWPVIAPFRGMGGEQHTRGAHLLILHGDKRSHHHIRLATSQLARGLPAEDRLISEDAASRVTAINLAPRGQCAVAGPLALEPSAWPDASLRECQRAF